MPRRVAGPAEPLLPGGTAPARLGPDAEVHVVDGDIAGVVDHEVDRPNGAGQYYLGGLLRIERHVRPPREVVAGSQGDQAEFRIGELTATVERGHCAVQRPVAARDHQPPGAAAIQHLVKVCPRLENDDLDRSLRLEDPDDRFDAFTIRGPGARVREKQKATRRTQSPAPWGTPLDPLVPGEALNRGETMR